MNCERCRWYDQDGFGKGLCRKHPPVVLVSVTTVTTRFPTVDKRDWCGQWEPHLPGAKTFGTLPAPSTRD